MNDFKGRKVSSVGISSLGCPALVLSYFKANLS